MLRNVVAESHDKKTSETCMRPSAHVCSHLESSSAEQTLRAGDSGRVVVASPTECSETESNTLYSSPAPS